MARHFTDETAGFKIPVSGKHSAADTSELDITQRFDPGFSCRPAVPAVPLRDDKNRWPTRGSAGGYRC